jgi:hypothetical protein
LGQGQAAAGPQLPHLRSDLRPASRLAPLVALGGQSFPPTKPIDNSNIDRYRIAIAKILG